MSVLELPAQTQRRRPVDAAIETFSYLPIC